MPMLKIKGIEEEEIKKVSKSLIDDLHKIIGCPRDYFTIEVIASTYISDGERVPAPPLIEVAWFDRGQDVQDQVAHAITNYFQKGKECLEIVFYTLEPTKYYENGTHF